MSETLTSAADRAAQLAQGDFAFITEMVELQAAAQPAKTAIRTVEGAINYGDLVAQVGRVGALLASRGVAPGDVVAVCGASSIPYITAFLGILRAGGTVAPLPPSATAADLAGMIADSGARFVFADRDTAQRLGAEPAFAPLPSARLDAEPLAWSSFDQAAPATVDPASAFNIIYSSGTTGTPKGIVQSHRMRWAHVQRGRSLGYDRDTVAIVATQPYSNLTLVSLLPTLALGGTVALMPEFEARQFLAFAQEARATHTFMVPVQYRRLLEVPDFDAYDLSSFRMKVCAGSHCPVELKQAILARWPGELVDLWGMTEGGGTCMLFANRDPGKLHTVGRPCEGHTIRILREDGTEAPPGEPGEVAGNSSSMMTGYHNRDDLTREIEWRDEAGRRFIRTGDIGVMDEDGFLSIVDRKKDMIISGGFNVYPSDIEAVLRAHPQVSDAAVVGVPSARWGETPVAFVVLRPGESCEGAAIRAWANERLGKTQRIAGLEVLDALPRSAIDKVLKRELKDRAIANGVAQEAG